MKSELVLGLVWLMTLLTYTREVPLDLPVEEIKEPGTTPNESDSEEIEWDAFKGTRNKAVDDSNIKGNHADRWNHSRMLLKTSTTLGYDEWWFMTTRRPIISYKDFPGRPGVATWKEISPGSTDTKKSRKTSDPTAAGVSSDSWRLLPTSHHEMLISFMMAAILFS